MQYDQLPPYPDMTNIDVYTLPFARYILKDMAMEELIMKRLVLFAMLCSLPAFAASEDHSQMSSPTMNWIHVKNCIIDVLPSKDLHGKVRSEDMLQCESADRGFYNQITGGYSLADAEALDQAIIQNAASRVYILESGSYIAFSQLDVQGKTDILEFCRETCQLLNN